MLAATARIILLSAGIGASLAILPADRPGGAAPYYLVPAAAVAFAAAAIAIAGASRRSARGDGLEVVNEMNATIAVTLAVSVWSLWPAALVGVGVAIASLARSDRARGTVGAVTPAVIAVLYGAVAGRRDLAAVFGVLAIGLAALARHHRDRRLLVASASSAALGVLRLGLATVLWDDVVARIPNWGWLTVGGTLLVATAVRLEQRSDDDPATRPIEPPTTDQGSRITESPTEA